MAPTFQPRLDILPEAQRRLWPELAALPAEFILYGGTAIALRLGHRQSIDFDFFARTPIDGPRLAAELPLLASAKIVQVEPNTLSCLVDRDGPVKLSFFGVPRLPVLALPDEACGVRVGAMVELGGMKAAVVQVRAEAKDYLDIDAMLTARSVTLAGMLAAAKALYGDGFAPLATLKALSFFDDGDLGSVSPKVRRRLATAVAAADLDRFAT